MRYEIKSTPQPPPAGDMQEKTLNFEPIHLYTYKPIPLEP
jgi:hypothetical protein